MSNYYGYARPEMAEFVPEDARRILDVGCGTGQFGRMLKSSRDIEVWGIEPVKAAAYEAEKHYDHVVCDLFTTDAGLPEKYFDVVIFNDSLEHMLESEPPLKLAQMLIKPRRGIIVASIPNFRYFDNITHILFDRDFEYTDEGILDRTHIRFFTLKSMKRLFADVGLDVISVTGINPRWWKGWKLKLLDIFFSKYLNDMKFKQFVITAKPKEIDTLPSPSE